MVYFVLTTRAIWCSNTEGNRQYGELFNSPCLAKLYSKYIIRFFLGFFIRWVVSAVCLYFI